MKKIISSLIVSSIVLSAAWAFPGSGRIYPQVTAPVYTTTAIDFNGSSSVVSKAADLTGNADSQKGILLIWFRMDGGDGAQQIFFEQKTTGYFGSQKPASNILRMIDAYNVAVANILKDETTTTYTSSAVWHSLLCSWDLSIPANACYVDDVAAPAASPLTSGTIDYANGNGWNFGARDSASRWFNGCMSDVYINFSQYLDLTNVANRRLFVTGSNTPVDLGANGSTPTGSQPIIFMKGDATTWANNLGSGGAFTATNITDCSTAP